MTPLPTWCDTPEGRALLTAIRLEQPDFFTVHRHAWTEQRRCKYRGHNAKALRAMHEAALEAAMDANDREAVVRLRNYEDADDLIERVLREPVVPWTRMSITERADGSAQVAA